MRSFEEEQLLLDGVTDDTLNVLSPSGDTSENLVSQSLPGESVRENYRRQGEARAADRVKAQICFDALEDDDHRCSHHGGKCYELWQLYIELKGLKK